MHDVEASAMEAGGTQEVWTVPGPGALWEFCFDKGGDFHFFRSIFGKSFLVVMDNAMLRKTQKMPVFCDSWKQEEQQRGFVCLCVHSYLIVCFCSTRVRVYLPTA